MTRYLIPFLIFIKTFKNIPRIRNANPEMWNPQKNPRMRIRGLIRFFLLDSERKSECSPKIRRIAIPSLWSSFATLTNKISSKDLINIITTLITPKENVGTYESNYT